MTEHVHRARGPRGKGKRSKAAKRRKVVLGGVKPLRRAARAAAT